MNGKIFEDTIRHAISSELPTYTCLHGREWKRMRYPKGKIVTDFAFVDYTGSEKKGDLLVAWRDGKTWALELKSQTSPGSVLEKISYVAKNVFHNFNLENVELSCLVYQGFDFNVQARNFISYYSERNTPVSKFLNQDDFLKLFYDRIRVNVRIYVLGNQCMVAIETT